jgi:hypothetical protein
MADATRERWWDLASRHTGVGARAVAVSPGRPREVVGGARARPFVREMQRDWEVFEGRFSFCLTVF